MGELPCGRELCVVDQFRANSEPFSASDRYVCQRPTRRPYEVTIKACGRILIPDIDANHQLVEDYAASPACANALDLPTGHERITPSEDYL